MYNNNNNKCSAIVHIYKVVATPFNTIQGGGVFSIKKHRRYSQRRLQRPRSLCFGSLARLGGVRLYADHPPSPSPPLLQKKKNV